MKYIEEKYQQLINSMERGYSATIDTLNYHINQLQRTVREQEAELDDKMNWLKPVIKKEIKAWKEKNE